ncbi:MAG: hypothetical protein APF84_09770 [Gracilibacter sp. BRH_c7a]|nr:MAG: hypothetical protein APF84_09770 [Gracilibacter sp. BRH_c7a]
MSMKKMSVLLCVLLVSQIWMSGCGFQKDVSKEREAWANEADNKIVIAVVGPIVTEDTFGYLDGIMLAAEEINENGGIDNRQIKILKFDDKDLTMEGINIAQDLAENPEIMAVIGHWSSNVTLPVASIYETSELLMITAETTSPKLTQSGYNYIFRNIPNDEKMGEEMAQFAKLQGHKRMAIYYADTDYGKGLANSFENSAESIGVKIVDRTTYCVDEYMFDRTMKRWKALDFDGVFIADSMPSVGEFILGLKEVYPEIPILGTDGLDHPDFIDVLGSAAEGVVIATLYDPNNQNPKLKQFEEEFKEYYGRVPNVYSVQGYETLQLLASAMELTDKQLPRETAEALRSMRQWPGLTGALNIEENGDVTGKVIHKKIVKNGEFEYWPVIQ